MNDRFPLRQAQGERPILIKLRHYRLAKAKDILHIKEAVFLVFEEARSA